MKEVEASPLEWARGLYADRTRTLRQIAEELGTSVSTVQRMAKTEGWPPRTKRKSAPKTTRTAARISAPETAPNATPKTTAKSEREADTRRKPDEPFPPLLKSDRDVIDGKSGDRKDLIDRLYRLVHHNVKILESRMSDENASDASGPERDMRVVGNLVRSVEKLKELEPEQSKRDTSSGNSRRDLITPEEEDIIRRRVVEHILKLRERKRRQDRDS